MNHDRIHAREPSHAVHEWSVGTIRDVEMRDGHVVFVVEPTGDSETAAGEGATPIELTVTTAIRDLVLRRLPGGPDDRPEGKRIWYKRRGR